MKLWKRADRLLLCGAEADCRIRSGDPYLELSGSGWTKLRCARHASEPVPAVIEEPVFIAPKPVEGFASTAALAKTIPWKPRGLDPKQRASGERE